VAVLVVDHLEAVEIDVEHADELAPVRLHVVVGSRAAIVDAQPPIELVEERRPVAQARETITASRALELCDVSPPVQYERKGSRHLPDRVPVHRQSRSARRRPLDDDSRTAAKWIRNGDRQTARKASCAGGDAQILSKLPRLELHRRTAEGRLRPGRVLPRMLAHEAGGQLASDVGGVAVDVLVHDEVSAVRMAPATDLGDELDRLADGSSFGQQLADAHVDVVVAGITADNDDAAGERPSVDARGGAELHRHPGAISPLHPENGGSHLCSAVEVFDGFEGAIDVARMDEVGDLLTEEFVGRVGKLSVGSRVAVCHDAGAVEQDDHIVLVFEHLDIDIAHAACRAKTPPLSHRHQYATPARRRPRGATGGSPQ
jgi:hypothetical protein